MRKYRLICLNAENAHFEVAEQFEAADDWAAVQFAKRLRKNRPAELWRGYTVVKVWNVR